MADERWPEAIRHPRWLIIGGAPRSGTTLLYNLLKRSPFLALKNERNLFEQALRDGEQAAAADYVRLLTPGQMRRVQHLGEKRPEYYEFPLHRCFPSGDVAIVHLSRRPRDAIGSMIARTRSAQDGQDDRWSPFFTVTDAVDAWLGAWRFAGARAQDPGFFHLKYEDLIADPSGQLESIVAWLGIDATRLSCETVVSPPAYPDLNKFASRHGMRRLESIDNNWQMPLAHLMNRYPATDTWLRAFRRTRRRLLWWYSVGRKRI